VIGIAPARLSPPGLGFATTDADAWRVISEHDRSPSYSRGAHYLDGVARMRPGVSLAQTRVELETIFAGLRVRYPETDTHFGVGVSLVLDDLIGDIRPTLFAIFAAVAGVLAIACANVANLLLGRASARERELAVRLALGASRRRIVMQLLTETFALALVGGAIGIALAYAGVRAFVDARPQFVPRIEDVRVDTTALLYTLGLIVVVTFVAGLLPALALSRRHLATALQSAGRSGDASRGARGRTALVIFEIACTLALVAVAGLVVRSYGALTSRPLGFDPTGLVVVGEVQLSRNRYATQARRADFLRHALARMRAVPGVVDASWTFGGPFLGMQWSQEFRIVGTPAVATGGPTAQMNPIGPAYFEVLHEPLRLGRTFTDADREGARGVVIVNEAFARKYLVGRSPIGQLLDLGGLPGRSRSRSAVTIVGVVADARESYARETPPTVYPAIAQSSPSIAYVVAKVAPGVAIAASLTQAISAVDPRMVRPLVAPLEDRLRESVARTRLTMQTLIALAVIALALSLAGIYAVVSYGVSQRTHEFGIRLALGANPTTIRRDVVFRAMRVATLGVASGLVLAALATQSLAITLYDVAPLDPLTFATVVTLVAGTALGAALVPAWRATRVDPIVALRYD